MSTIHKFNPVTDTEMFKSSQFQTEGGENQARVRQRKAKTERERSRERERDTLKDPIQNAFIC